MSVDDRLGILDQSIQNCHESASRLGPHFCGRPESVAACRKTKALLHQLGQEENHDRNLACSSRIAALDLGLWIIQLIAGIRLYEKTDKNLTQLERNYVNIDSR
jgi:hypothetical protein